MMIAQQATQLSNNNKNKENQKNLFHSDMDVPLNGGTPKTPQNDHF